MRRHIFIAALIVLAMGCSFSEKVPKDKAVMHQIAQKFLIQMQHCYSCKLIAIGGSVKDHPGMEDQFFMFNFQYDLTKDQARYLLLFCAQEFINSVNESEVYKQHLPRPYSYENLHLSFWFEDDANETLRTPKIAGISLQNNILRFRKYEGALISSDRREIVESETLEEAKALNEAYLKQLEAGLEVLPF